MPRTISAPDRAKSQATVVRHVLRAEVKDVDGSWQDLRDLGPSGVNVLVGGTISTTTDELVWRAAVRVRLGRDTDGLSPLVAASLFNRDGVGVYAPLLTPGAEIRLHADTLAPGEVESDSSKRLMFWGRVDRAEFASDPMTLTCRDLGGKLLDTIVREKRTYGDPDAPVPAHLVMQQFLADNADLLGGTAPTLAVPDAPTYLVTEFVQVGVSILDALNTLAMLFGWVVRYAFDASDDFVLTLYDPQRDRVIPAGGDYAIAPTEYHAVDAAALDMVNVRNRLKGWYRDGVTGEALSVEVRDDGSIAAFGERFEQFGGDLLLPITNGNDMLAFLQYALADQATPPFDHTVSALFLHFVALGDVPEFSGNAVQYDEPQQLAVVGITHEFPDAGDGPSVTQLACRGTPSGAYKRWLRFRGGPVFPDIPPSPSFSDPLGEAIMFGSALNDGSNIIFYGFKEGVDEIQLFAEIGDGSAIPVPDATATTLAATIRRPEGDIGLDPNYASVAVVTAREGFYKRYRGRGVRAGLSSPDWVSNVVQAVDPSPAITRGQLNALAVARTGDTENTVTVTPASLDTAAENFMVVMRNEQELPPIYMGVSLAPVVFLDKGLDLSNPQKSYTYDAFILSKTAAGAVTGQRFRYVFGNPPAANVPVWALGTPSPAIVAGVAKVQLSWTATTPGAGQVRVEASLDRISKRVVGAGATASGTVYDNDPSNKLYRLVAVDILTGREIAASEWVWYTGGAPPLSNPGALPQFANGTPKPVFTTTFPTPTIRLLVQWTVATPGVRQIWVYRATAGVGGPFSLVPNGQVRSDATGQWVSPTQAWINEEGWYKLEARDMIGALLATSAVVHYVPLNP